MHFVISEISSLASFYMAQIKPGKYAYDYELSIHWKWKLIDTIF